MANSEKSLWELAVQQSKENEENQMDTGESSILFVGSRNCGKTSMILRFLDRDEAAKPTTVLEYTFGRRAKGHNVAKDIGNIWELGGGTRLSKLIEIPINVHTIRAISLVLVLDLSKPDKLWSTLETLLDAASKRINDVLISMAMDNSNIKEELKKRAWQRIGPDHQDRELLNPFLIPLVIIGAKYDTFMDFDPEKRKIICKTLRFIAHHYGAHLQFCSRKHEALMNKTRGLVSHLLFSTPSSKTLQIDHNKPLMIPFGQDAFQQIGTPPLPEGDLGRVTARNPLELWKLAYIGHFPQNNEMYSTSLDDLTKDVQYTEYAVDAMRAQKDQELERYRRACEHRMTTSH